MIVKLNVHIEVHRGYWPRISVRLAPRDGQHTRDGQLMRCPLCSGDGFLVDPHVAPTVKRPT